MPRYRSIAIGLTVSGGLWLFGSPAIDASDKAGEVSAPAAGSTANEPSIPLGNHYACYPIRQKIPPKIVTLKDQFGQRSFRVDEITRLCAPTAKTLAPAPASRVPNPELHALCYRLSPHGPKPLPVNQRVVVNNQFGRAELVVQGLPNEICLPTGKRTACVRPPAGMTHWWPGDGNANNILTGVAGTMIGTTFAAGEVGSAFSFNGAGSHIQASEVGPMGTAARTVDAWIRPKRAQSNAVVESQAIVDYGDHQTTGGEFYFGVEWQNDGNNSVPGLGFRTQNARIIFDAPGLDDGNFHHVAIVVPSAATVQAVTIYMDGAALTGTPRPYLEPDGGTYNATIPIDTRPKAPIRIGLFVAGVVPPAYYGFKGEIDEVEIFNRTLSAAEIGAIYSAGSAGKCKRR